MFVSQCFLYFLSYFYFCSYSLFLYPMFISHSTLCLYSIFISHHALYFFTLKLFILLFHIFILLYFFSCSFFLYHVLFPIIFFTSLFHFCFSSYTLFLYPILASHSFSRKRVSSASEAVSETGDDDTMTSVDDRVCFVIHNIPQYFTSLVYVILNHCRFSF